MSQVDNIRPLRRTGGKNKANQRLSANWLAELRAGASEQACQVIDISAAGARLGGLRKVHPNHHVWLLVQDNEPIEARIAWSRGGQAGLNFVREQTWVSKLATKRFDPAAWLDT